MAKQAKRGRSAPLATGRSLTDAWSAPASAAPPAKNSATDSAGQADSGAVTLSGPLDDHADLAGANLAKADLRGARLRFANLSGADLEAADLSGAHLELALFNQANLSTANLSDAVLDHASFARANFANAKLSGASLRFASLEDTRFDAADLSSVDFRHARLDRADLKAANLSSALLDYADFSGASLVDADLRGAQLRYAKNLTRAQLDQGKVSATTILPLTFDASQGRPWGSNRSQAASRRPIWIAGTLLAASVSLALAWQLFGPSEMAYPTGANAAALPAVAAHGGASGASPIVATSAEFALLRPAFRAPTLAAAPSAASVSPTARRDAAADVLTSLSVPDTVSSAVFVPVRLSLSSRHPPVLSDVSPTFLTAVTVIQTVAVRELQVADIGREPSGKAPKPPLALSPGFEPLTLVVSLREQKIDVYRGVDLVTSSKISSGKRGHDTRAGVFSILEKRRHHHSNLYSGAPMPWMQRLTWSGTALHGGVVPGYPASHGCIRLPFSFAPKLFEMTTVGANVVVAGGRVAPKPVEHANLFQPVRTEVAVATAEPDLVLPQILSVAAAEPAKPAERNGEVTLDGPSPLRILVTRRTKRDHIITTQNLLAALGYLKPQSFSGWIGPETTAAIKAFQKANGLRQTGAFSDELARKVHQIAGVAEPPSGHLFVRQDFSPVLDVPIAFSKPEQPLGTHVFTMGLAPGGAKAEWTAVSLEGGDSASVLDRFGIPENARRIISEHLTPGSSLIVADTSLNSAILPDGDDFLVLAKATPAIAAVESRPGATPEAARVKRDKAAKAVAKPPVQGTRKRIVRRVDRAPDPYGGFRLFRRW